MKTLTFPRSSHSSSGSISSRSDRWIFNLEPGQLLELIKELSKTLSNQQKTNLLEHLTTNIHLGHLESLRLTSRLHSKCVSFTDCYDFVSWLPPELVARIFSYLSWDSLLACSLVNRAWYAAARNPELYRRLCQLPEWRPLVVSDKSPSTCASAAKCSSGLSVPRSCTISEGPLSFGLNTRRTAIDWFGVFQKHSRLRRNWLLGKHRKRRFTGHSEAVYCVAYDAYRIVSGSADATIRVWNVRTNANWSVQTLRGHSDAVRCLQLLSSSQSVNSCTFTPSSVKFADESDSDAPSVWHPPEATLISGSTDTTIKVWRLSTTKQWSRIACIATLQGHTDTVRCLQADRQKVVSGSYDCTLRLWNLGSNHTRRVFRGHVAGVVCLTYGEELLYSGSLDNTVRVWCLHSGVCLYTLHRSVPSPTSQFWLTPVSSLYLDIPHNRLIISHHDGVILTWSLPPESQVTDVRANISQANAYPTGSDPVSVCLTEHFGATGSQSGSIVRCIGGDGWHIVCGSDDKTLRVWLADSNELITTLNGHEDGVTCAVVTASVVVSGSYDKSVLLYDFDIT